MLSLFYFYCRLPLLHRLPVKTKGELEIRVNYEWLYRFVKFLKVAKSIDLQIIKSFQLRLSNKSDRINFIKIRLIINK